MWQFVIQSYITHTEAYNTEISAYLQDVAIDKLVNIEIIVIFTERIDQSFGDLYKHTKHIK